MFHRGMLAADFEKGWGRFVTSCRGASCRYRSLGAYLSTVMYLGTVSGRIDVPKVKSLAALYIIIV